MRLSAVLPTGTVCDEGDLLVGIEVETEAVGAGEVGQAEEALAGASWWVKARVDAETYVCCRGQGRRFEFIDLRLNS